ncbi:hypothetical protein TNCV_3506731 [Trichonephila clavipes]|uniref:Uncharacterized protein n=1 Tax=Trichonephila clavipes TaxID=2585209 RepID=A0A8X6S975_TRICX|nr:hypothetical protein TNCV_3506731 [Trichonephila clavipes]
MPSPVQSNCDAHDIIANGQRRTSNTTSPCRLLHIPVVLNDFHSRETTLVETDSATCHTAGVQVGGESFQTIQMSRLLANWSRNDRSGRPSSSTSEINSARAKEMIQYFQFPRMKEHLSGRRFSSDNAMKTSVKTWCKEQGPDFY